MLEDPRNTLRHTCEEFYNRYRGHESGLFVYGDATSKKADTKLEKGTNFYTLILQHLASFKPQLRINNVNPSVVMKRLFIENILNYEYDIRLMIDNSCKKSIYDYKYAKESVEGGIDKKMITNKVTGKRYQEFGHAIDGMSYIVTTIFKEQYNLFLKGGQRTTLRIGMRERQ
jgi:hypothetical protein